MGLLSFSFCPANRPSSTVAASRLSVLPASEVVCALIEGSSHVLPQMKDRLKNGTLDKKGALNECHLPPMLDEVELLRTEILTDAKPLSRILIKTDDEALLAVLGDSGVCSTDTETETAAEME